MAVTANTFKLGRSDEPGLADFAQAEHRRRHAVRQDGGRTMLQWALQVPERGQPLDLVHFPFQEEWYSEEIADARRVVWMKAAQVGMSGYAWRWAGRRAEQWGDRVIYFFPTDDDVANFGDQRIEPSIEDSELLKRRIPAHFVRNKHLKRIGAGDLSLRGTKSRTAVQSVDADALVFDEYDYHDQANLAQAERRLAGAQAAGRDPRLRWLGYPTLPGMGIHGLYTRSDKRVWHVTCPKCETEQSLSWEENMRWRGRLEPERVLRATDDEFEDMEDVTEAWRVCSRCEASLEPVMLRGEWRSTNRAGTLVGYHVPRLIVPRTDLLELVVSSRKTKPFDIEAFYQNDLGLPWVPAEAALTEADVMAACSLGGDPQTIYRGRFPIVAGVDVASERDLSMWIDELWPDGSQKAIHISEPRDFREVSEKIGRFGVNLCVIDSMPERRQARAVASDHPGRVVLAVYDERNESDAFRYDDKKNIVHVNRTEAMDAFMDGVRQQRRIPLRRPPVRFVEQLTSPKRRTELNTAGRPRRVYVSTGPVGDDYAHAGVYGLVAKEMWVQKQMVQQAMEQAAGAAVADERFGFNDQAYDRIGGW